jgi:hypothetical protein
MATKKATVAAPAASTAINTPSFQKVVEAFATLFAIIEREVADLEARVGVGNVLFSQVEAIVQRALVEFQWSALKDLIKNELVVLAITGRSVVKDDDTDIA